MPTSELGDHFQAPTAIKDKEHSHEQAPQVSHSNQLPDVVMKSDLHSTPHSDRGRHLNIFGDMWNAIAHPDRIKRCIQKDKDYKKYGKSYVDENYEPGKDCRKKRSSNKAVFGTGHGEIFGTKEGVKTKLEDDSGPQIPKETQKYDALGVPKETKPSTKKSTGSDMSRGVPPGSDDMSRGLPPNTIRLASERIRKLAIIMKNETSNSPLTKKSPADDPDSVQKYWDKLIDYTGNNNLASMYKYNLYKALTDLINSFIFKKADTNFLHESRYNKGYNNITIVHTKTNKRITLKLFAPYAAKLRGTTQYKLLLRKFKNLDNSKRNQITESIGKKKKP